MITKIIEKNRVDNDYTFSAEYRGLSTDDKPTDAKNGELFLEMDTGNVYIFNEASHTWVVL